MPVCTGPRPADHLDDEREHVVVLPDTDAARRARAEHDARRGRT